MPDLDLEYRNFVAAEANDRKWTKGPKISKSDCINKTGFIESDDSKGESEPRVTFGKHKGKTYKWIKDNDPFYYKWAKAEIPKFKLEAEKHESQSLG